nr:unnamed protein product [Callosobruchus chinensis]
MQLAKKISVDVSQVKNLPCINLKISICSVPKVVQHGRRENEEGAARSQRKRGNTASSRPKHITDG